MAQGERAEEIARRTIADFGEQWSHYAENDGYYASQELLADVFGPLLPVSALAGVRAADVGSGTGRFARLMLEAGARHVLAVEPSQAVETLRRHLAPYGDRATVQHGRGEELPAGLDLDLVFSFGVLQFIPDPLPVVKAAHAALRPGGRFVFWVYGKEGVRVYAALVQALRAVTVRMPHPLLSGLCSVLNACLDPYIFLCRRFPGLPLRAYAVNTLGRLERRHRKLVLYDQLNPRYVRFYAREEVEALLRAGGFSHVELHHRHGYSWTAMGVKDPA